MSILVRKVVYQWLKSITGEEWQLKRTVFFVGVGLDYNFIFNKPYINHIRTFTNP